MNYLRQMLADVCQQPHPFSVFVDYHMSVFEGRNKSNKEDQTCRTGQKDKDKANLHQITNKQDKIKLISTILAKDNIDQEKPLCPEDVAWDDRTEEMAFLVHRLMRQKKKIFRVEEVKRKLKCNFRKLICRHCQCCGRDSIKHKCSHVLCQKKCEKYKKKVMMAMKCNKMQRPTETIVITANPNCQSTTSLENDIHENSLNQEQGNRHNDFEKLKFKESRDLEEVQELDSSESDEESQEKAASKEISEQQEEPEKPVISEMADS